MMNTMKIAAAATLMTGSMLVLGMARVQPDDADPPRLEPAVDLAAPSVVHQDMMARAGDYVTVTRMRPTPDAEWITTEGSATLTANIGGRFLMEKSTGVMMGQEMESIKLWGFNNATGKIESVWTYNMSTAMLTMKGAVGDDGVIRLKGSWDEADGTETVDIALHLPDGNHFIIEMMGHGMGDADTEPFVVMETTYTRAEN